MARTPENDSWRIAALMIGLVGSALLVGPTGGLDGFSTAKLLAIGVAAATVVAFGGSRSLGRSQLRARWAPPILAAAAVVVAGFVVTLTSPSPRLALAGAFGRWSGLALYAAGFVLFLAASRLRRGGIATLLRGILITAGLVGLLALDQATIDLAGLPAGEFGTSATLGNPNFLSAYAAIALPLAAYAILNRAWPRGWRITAAASGVLCLVGVAVSRSAQGVLVAAAVGTLLALVAGSLRWSRTVVRGAVAVAGVVTVLAAGVLVAGAIGAGPLDRLSSDVGVQHRVYYWQAAVDIFAAQPVTGVGPGHFAYHYREVRPLEDALESPATDNTDSAHNVPLQMFAEGGLVWGLPYLAFLVTVGAALAQALRVAAGRDRLLVGAIGGAWLGYVLQSLISIDVPPLAVLGWILSGLIVALAPATARVTEIQLPWRRKGKRGRAPLGQRVAQGSAVVLGLLVVWLFSIPFRADLSASDPRALETATTPDQLEDRTTELAGWEPEYWLRLVAPLAEQGELQAAATFAGRAVEAAPKDLGAVLTSARLEAENGNQEQAHDRYQQALRIEPQHPEVALEVARFAQETGDEASARQLAQDVLEVAPDHDDAQELLESLGGAAAS